MTEGRDRLHVLQVTDCHLLPSADATLLGVRTADSLAAVLEAACRERTPDAVLATGDIAQTASPATYELFLTTLARYYAGPLMCVPGNHDHGATLSGALPTDDVALGAWRLVGVDTHEDDVVGGTVDPTELSRLRSVLKRCGEGCHVLVAGHHCPVGIGCSWLDAHRIDNGDELIEALCAAGVRGYVFGHIHQEAEADPGLPVYGTPSTCFQFADDSPTFGIDTAKPGYRWLSLHPDGTIETAIRRVDDYELNLDFTDRANR